MRRFLLLLALRFASALNTTYNGTITCPHDALYTSLVDDGGDYCSSVLEASHCGGWYRTPTQFASVNQTRIASYCKCIVTGSDAGVTATGSGNWTTGDATATTLNAGSGTSGQASTRTRGSPFRRPGPGNPSGTDSATDSETMTGSGNWTIGEPTATTLDPSQTSEPLSTETRSPHAGRPRPSEPSGSDTATETSGSATNGASGRASSGLSRPTIGGTSTFGGWNSSMTARTASGTGTGVGTGSRSATRVGTGTEGAGGSVSGTGVPVFSGNSTLSSSRASLSRGSSRTDSEGISTGSGTRTGTLASRVSETATASGLITDSTSGTVTAAPTLNRPTAFPNGTSPITANSTSPTVSEIPVANFTRVTRTAHVTQETCYTLPRGPGNNPTRALLHNSKLRELNVSIPLPYIESVDFENGGIDPLYLTVRDTEEGSHYLDVSNKSHVAIADGLGYTMMLDATGIHFSSNSCTYDVHITIRNLYRQLASLAGVECSVGSRHKRMDDMDFQQTLSLHDQCGDSIDKSLRPYPQLYVGDTLCTNTDVNEITGEWDFDCTFPGSQSGSMKCQYAIKNDVEDFLLKDPFGGSCPDLSTVITTLSETGRDFMNAESLRTELYNQGLDDYQKLEADQAVTAYEDLWRVLQETFVKNTTNTTGNTTGNTCALERYITLYNTYRNFEDDICTDLHAGEIPLPLTLTAGSTTIPPITTLNWAPTSPRTYNLTVQDPSKIACCADGRVADTSGDTCAYPADAVIGGTGCVCGRTADGRSVGFEVTECDNYVSGCEKDADCGDAGFGGFVCLVGTCCEGGVCVDPYACSQNGTRLV